jgi:hypothetical protein
VRRVLLLRLAQSTLKECRGSDRKGTLIRHARSRRSGVGLLSLAVLALPVAMIEPSFRALLMPPIGTPPLPPARKFAARRAAITVSAITVRADEESYVTLLTQADSLPQNCFVMNLRHASSQAGLDSGRRFVAG